MQAFRLRRQGIRAGVRWLGPGHPLPGIGTKCTGRGTTRSSPASPGPDLKREGPDRETCLPIPGAWCRDPECVGLGPDCRRYDLNSTTPSRNWLRADRSRVVSVPIPAPPGAARSRSGRIRKKTASGKRCTSVVERLPIYRHHRVAAKGIVSGTGWEQDPRGWAQQNEPRKSGFRRNFRALRASPAAGRASARRPRSGGIHRRGRRPPHGRGGNRPAGRAR
jgi:hypothetical protein